MFIFKWFKITERSELPKQNCSFPPRITAPLYSFWNTCFYITVNQPMPASQNIPYCSARNHSLPMEAEAPCPLERLTQVELGKQKGPCPPVPRALPFGLPAGTLHSRLPKPSDWGSSSFALVPSSRKPQIHLFAICSKNKMALGNEVDGTVSNLSL